MTPPTGPILDRLFLELNVRASFTIVAILWTKTAFAITLLRLTDGWTKRFVWFVIISMNLALGLSALLRWVLCTPLKKSWTPTIVEGSCVPFSVMINYDIFSGAYSGAMDLVLALLPWKVIWALQMKRAEKIGVAVCMSMGVFAAIVAFVKSSKLHNLASPDFYDYVELFVWDITESAVTMIAASIPILRILLREVRASTRRYYISEEQDSTELHSRIKTGDTMASRNTFSKTTSSGGNSSESWR